MRSNKYIIILITLVFSINFAFAGNSTLAKSIIAESESILAEKENAITLEELQQMVSNDSLDVQISYERLLQAQKKIGSARAQYFPYGIGAVASLYFYGSFSYLILAELITSLPSKIYNVQSTKNVRKAQAENLKTVKANIKNQIAKMYYNFLKDEALLKIASLELKLMEADIASTEENIELGMSTDVDLTNLKYKYLTLRDVYLRFSGYYNQSLKALNIATGRDSTEEVLKLQPVNTYLSADQVRMSSAEMETLAIENSSELKAANYMIKAAHHNTNSVRWSVLSFSGIGFGYMSRIRFSKSARANAYYNRDSVQRNIENQVYTRRAKLINSIGIFNQDHDLYNVTKSYVEGDIEEYKSGQLTLSKVIQTELIYLSDFRETIRSHYQALIDIDNLKRLVGQNVYGEGAIIESIEPETELAELKIKKRGRVIRINAYNMISSEKIESVQYEFNDRLFKEMKSFSSSNNFAVKLYTRTSSTKVSGRAIITMENGEQIIKEFKI